VDAAIADAFADKLAAKAATLVAGDPRRANTPLGSVIGLNAVERIDALVKDAVARGARIIAGGHARGTLMDATVLDHLTSAMRIYNEETFGPVVSIVRVNGRRRALPLPT
jgi:acyl-CoA reductase-like NAD-dependent aldehyde dehydrogenase